MKKYITLLIMALATYLATAQGTGYKYNTPDPDFYYYLNVSADANNLFNIKDNNRMETQVNGLDYDVELGLKRGNIQPYIFYGQFPNAKINNYGLGLDITPNILNNIDTGAGLGWSRIDQTGTGGIGGFYARGVASWKFHQNIALTARLQAQQRTDVSKGFIYEAAIGLTFKLHDKE